MKKYDILGTEMVKVSELRHVIRRLRRDIDIMYHNFDEEHRAIVHLAYNDIVKALYREELNNAKSPDEIKEIMEMPGDYVVASGDRRSGLIFFSMWEDGKPIFSRKGYMALRFDYESKAKEIAEQLGEGWKAIDVTIEEYEDNKRLLHAIFDDVEEEE